MKVNTTEKTTLRGELALIVAVIINSFWGCFDAVFWFRNFSNLQCALRILRSISMVNTWHLDIPFSGSSGFKPDDSSKKICSDISVQFCSGILFWNSGGCT